MPVLHKKNQTEFERKPFYFALYVLEKLYNALIILALFH